MKGASEIKPPQVDPYATVPAGLSFTHSCWSKMCGLLPELLKLRCWYCNTNANVAPVILLWLFIKCTCVYTLNGAITTRLQQAHDENVILWPLGSKISSSGRKLCNLGENKHRKAAKLQSNVRSWKIQRLIFLISECCVGVFELFSPCCAPSRWGDGGFWEFNLPLCLIYVCPDAWVWFLIPQSLPAHPVWSRISFLDLTVSRSEKPSRTIKFHFNLWDRYLQFSMAAGYFCSCVTCGGLLCVAPQGHM